jgi:diguanylate cyclase
LALIVHLRLPLFIISVLATRLLQVRTYPIIRWSALGIFLIHLGLRLLIDGPHIWIDLIGYNLIALVACVALFNSPSHNDPLAIAFLVCAIASWASGSLLSSFGQFYTMPSSVEYLANISYTLFYPFILFAIPRILNRRKSLSVTEMLDAAIFGLGLSSIATALIFSQVISVGSGQSFFELFYPICDLVLLITLAIASITQVINRRFMILVLGFAIYLLFDYLFLWKSLEGSYQFGTAFDNGWVLGIIVIAQSLWFSPSITREFIPIHPAFIALSIFISPSLLAMMALRPGIFPSYIVFPAIATLFLAFIRMTVSLRQASALTDEKTLARTDELTGLPNRRKLIAALSEFSEVEGALMLLDLNGFKQVNDRSGHRAGDQVLIQVAARFARVLPEGALLARLGGDEFGILLAGTKIATQEIAQALQACVSYPFLIDGEKISVGVSIGHVDNSEGGDLLAKADAAMYRVKRSISS